jgi:hypothetical protein
MQNKIKLQAAVDLALSKLKECHMYLHAKSYMIKFVSLGSDDSIDISRLM